MKNGIRLSLYYILKGLYVGSTMYNSCYTSCYGGPGVSAPAHAARLLPKTRNLVGFDLVCLDKDLLR
jgi:hypothetical protein